MLDDSVEFGVVCWDFLLEKVLGSLRVLFLK